MHPLATGPPRVKCKQTERNAHREQKKKKKPIFNFIEKYSFVVDLVDRNSIRARTRKKMILVQSGAWSSNALENLIGSDQT